ncbi:MAG: hypothetical protein AAF944_01220 [Bacteroidota bacterium]
MDKRNEEIVKRFQHSWDKVEKHYEHILQHNGWEYLIQLTKAIEYWREIGLDKVFRAGNSIHYLILSRSVEHGLRGDQKRILIIPNSDGTYEINFFEETKKYKELKTNQLLGNRELERLLKILESVLVD